MMGIFAAALAVAICSTGIPAFLIKNGIATERKPGKWPPGRKVIPKSHGGGWRGMA